MSDELKRDAREYHSHHPPGKLEVSPTKPLANQRDLALAYSPGVAAACEAIVEDPLEVNAMTARGNMVAVITNGTAVLGLGDIGPLAAKPVMEGKAVLFKKFAGIDVFDIEINEHDPDKLVDIIASLEPTFAGINLEDIKSPECFQVEGRLKRKVKIPVFHDDQHGTAIIASAAVMNALELVGKDIGEIKLVTAGAGAAAIACLKLLVELGVNPDNILVNDHVGTVYRGRKELMDPHKKRFAADTAARTLAEAIVDADVFLGLSTGNVLSQEMVKKMADRPIILALANPNPEILPEEVKAVRPDAIIATGRSDYPNQVNNVLCFPYIFRGALDVGATEINNQMKIACVHALAKLARSESSDIVAAAYRGESLVYGPDYLIPKPFDPRLILELSPAVAQAAMDSGVATRPIDDMDAYHFQLDRFVFQSVMMMRPVFERAKSLQKRLVYAEGEHHTVLRAVQSVVDEGLALPVLIGRRQRILDRISMLGLRLRIERDFEVIEANSNDIHPTACAAQLLARGEVDGLLCGLSGSFMEHKQRIIDIIGIRDDLTTTATMQVLILKKGTYFICDTFVNAAPSAEQIAEYTCLAAEMIQRFGITPRVALLSHSSFGSSQTPTAEKMRRALLLLKKQNPELQIDGEMQADAALIERIRKKVNPQSPLEGQANLLVMPNLDAANITMHLLTVLGNGASVGPIFMGPKQPAHILTPAATVRRIVNMSALAVVESQMETQ